MTDIAGTVPIQTTAASQGSVPGGTAGKVVNPPPSALQLLAGDSLFGTVLSSDAKGHVLVRTELGTLTIMTPLKPAIGSSITLQVRHIGSELLVLLFAGHSGRPDRGAQQSVGGNTRSSAGGTSGGSLAGKAQGAAVAGGQPALETTARPAPGQQQLPGDRLSIGQRLPATVQSPAGQVPGGSAGAPSVAPGQLPAGAEVQLRILAITPASGAQADKVLPAPEQSNAQTSSHPPGVKGTITAVVVGQNRDGQTLLRSPLGLLSVDAKVTLPMGSQVSAELIFGQASPLPWTGQGGLTPTGLAIGWSSLEEATQLLSRTEALDRPSLAGGPVIPRPGPGLSSGLLFFMAALAQGRFENWLAPVSADRLRSAGGPELVARLGEEFRQLAQLAAEPSAGEWRVFLIPLFDGNQLQQLRLFLRHGGQGDGGNDEDEQATRFLLDLEVSRLGALQLDGLVQSGRFDLMFRSRRALPAHMQRDITEIFDSANEASGTRGVIQFQASRDWSPQSLPDVAQDSLLV